MKKRPWHEKTRSKGARRLITLILIAALVFSLADVSSYAVTSEDVESQSDVVSELEEEQEELEEEIADLEEETSLLSDEVSELNDEISDISYAIEDLAVQISQKEEEIADLEEEISSASELMEEAEAAYDEQYEALSSWIRYTYIYDTDSMLVSLLSSQSIADFLNRIQYIQSMFEYGQELMEGYESLAGELAERKSELEAGQEALLAGLEELEALEEETSSKKSELSAAVSAAQDSLSASESELSYAESAAAELEEEIAAQKAYEEELEAQLAAQEAANISTILSQEEENTADAVVSTDEADLELLAALIYCEAGGEIYEGQVAVGCVVMNRVRSSYFPNTVSGVIYQSGQFSPVASGRLATVLANGLTTQSCYNAAAYVLAGNLPYPDFLYFRSASVTLTGVTVTWIGNQQFF